MRKEIYSVKCPKRVQLGDPMYYEKFKEQELARLVVDCKPPNNFAARLVLTEETIEECPDEIFCNMTLYMAPEATINTYMEGYAYNSQETLEKRIGVDTARYLINVDGRCEEVYTGADGYWGTYLELFRRQGTNKILDAIVISMDMSEFQDFEWMKHLTSHFFIEFQFLENSGGQDRSLEMK